LGWIADDIADSIPGLGLVEEDTEGFKAVAYARASVLAAAAVKELKGIMDAEVSALKAEIEALKKRLDEIERPTSKI
jgi:hypothetical protein